ncbi:GSCOCG00003632001-RA-CDS [Cotesia congregata]|nr:GSCOCG00003632001-RA-CDS [Cotesia congregata]
MEWGDHADNERGRYLRRWEYTTANHYNAKIYPTHIPSRTDSNTYLDICITDLQITDLINNKLSTCEYDSDHLALTFTVKLPNRMEYIDRQQTLHRFNFKATKWGKFQHKLQSNYNTIIPDDKNLTIKEIDEFIEDINKSILTTIEETEIIRLKELIKLTKAELRKEFGTSSATYYANLLKEINHRDASTFFPKINRYLRRKNPINEKEYFFCNSHSLNLILQRLPNKTSSGVDGIPTIILKHLPGNIIQALVIIFNNALNAYYFPKPWKKAKVLPILKKDKDPSKATSYRPISLTPTLSKVYETVINTQINKICKENNIIPDQQFGFKHQHSTIQSINKLVSDIQRSLHYNQLVGALLIDLEKAFDSVWLNGLIYRLIKLGFPEWMTLLIFDMIHDKTFIIWDGTNSTNTTFKILEGLQQRTVNSPTLFSIYLSTLLSSFDLNKGDLKAIAFADDLVVYLPGKSPLKIQDGLQKLLNVIDEFMQTWNLRINYTKCETIVFRRSTHFLTKGSRSGLNTFTLKGTNPGTDTVVNIPHKSIVKYLGVYLDDKLRLNKHINIQLNKASAALKSQPKLILLQTLD